MLSTIITIALLGQAPAPAPSPVVASPERQKALLDAIKRDPRVKVKLRNEHALQASRAAASQAARQKAAEEWEKGRPAREAAAVEAAREYAKNAPAREVAELQRQHLQLLRSAEEQRAMDRQTMMTQDQQRIALENQRQMLNYNAQMYRTNLQHQADMDFNNALRGVYVPYIPQVNPQAQAAAALNSMIPR